MDYEYDSEAEWTDEEEGEELKSDDEDEEANDQWGKQEMTYAF